MGFSGYLVALLLKYVHIDLGGFAVAVAFHGAHSLRSIGKAAKNPLQMIYFLGQPFC